MKFDRLFDFERNVGDDRSIGAMPQSDPPANCTAGRRGRPDMRVMPMLDADATSGPSDVVHGGGGSTTGNHTRRLPNWWMEGVSQM
jgi:hypothetical protein